MLSRITAAVGVCALAVSVLSVTVHARPSAAASTATRAQVIAYIEGQNDKPGGLTQDGGVELLNLSSGSTQTLLLHQRVTGADVSSDGSTLLYSVYTPDDADNTGLFTMPLDGSGGRTRVDLGGCSGGVGKWSPNGAQIVVGDSCGLFVVDTATDDTVARVSGSTSAYPTFSPDGKNVYFSDGGGDIYSYTLADQSVATLAESVGEQPVPSPDGTTIAYRSDYDATGQKLWVMNTDGTNRHELTSATPHPTDEVTTLSWSHDSSTVFAGVNTVNQNDSMTNNDIYAVDRTNRYRRAVTQTPDVNEDAISVGVVDRTSDSRGAAFTALSPARVLDTRNGTGGAKAPLAAGGVRDVHVAGVAGVPADATAVTVNLTATGAKTGTYLSLVPTPAGSAGAPTTSTLNLAAGQTLANGAGVAVGANGSIRVYNHSGNVNAILDVTGYTTG